MKQRLKSLKRSNKLLIAAAFVAAIVIVIFGLFKFTDNNRRKEELEALAKSTKEIDKEFSEKYKAASETDVSKQKDFILNWFKSLFFSDADVSFKSKSEIIEILDRYPSNSEDIITRKDIYSVVFGSAQYGYETLNEFISNCRLGIPGTMVMAQFTTNLDPIYTYIEYDGSRYHILEDKTRDGYDDETGYVEVYGKYLKFEQYSDQEGGIIEYGYLTDDIKMTYSQVLNYYATVDSVGPDNIKLPDFWQFYVGIISKDDWENRALTPDRVSKEFTEEYTGYLDMHPSYMYDNPLADYDKDGIYDRIFRQYLYKDNASETSVFCFMGNGNNIQLAKNAWGEKYKTKEADLNSDGNKDIVFIQYSDSSEDVKSEASVFLYKSGNYVPSRLPKDTYSSIDVGLSQDGTDCLVCVSSNDDQSESVYLKYRNNKWETEEAIASSDNGEEID